MINKIESERLAKRIQIMKRYKGDYYKMYKHLLQELINDPNNFKKKYPMYDESVQLKYIKLAIENQIRIEEELK